MRVRGRIASMTALVIVGTLCLIAQPTAAYGPSTTYRYYTGHLGTGSYSVPTYVVLAKRKKHVWLYELQLGTPYEPEAISLYWSCGGTKSAALAASAYHLPKTIGKLHKGHLTAQIPGSKFTLKPYGIAAYSPNPATQKLVRVLAVHLAGKLSGKTLKVTVGVSIQLACGHTFTGTLQQT